MPAGRKKAYKNKKEFEKQVRKYFNSISATVPVMDGENLVTNDDGEPLNRLVYYQPPTVTALCLYLKINRRTWSNYAKDPQFCEVVEWAEAMCEGYLETQLLTRDRTNGIQFALGNYGWREKREVSVEKETRDSLTAESFGLSEKLALLAEVNGMMKELSGDG